MKKFKKFYVELTSRCNLACTFCPPTHRATQYITLDQFRHTLDEVKPYTDYIYFHVKGEPLLHPHIDQLLDIAHEKGFKVNITSNGTLLHKAGPKLMNKPALRQMNFSLHSFDGHVGSKDKDAYIAKVLNFVKEATANSNLIVSLRLWNLDMDNATNLEKQRNREMLAYIEKEFGLDYNIEEKVQPGKGVKIADRIYINMDHEFEWPDLNAEEDFGPGFCHGLRNQAWRLGRRHRHPVLFGRGRRHQSRQYLQNAFQRHHRRGTRDQHRRRLLPPRSGGGAVPEMRVPQAV